MQYLAVLIRFFTCAVDGNSRPQLSANNREQQSPPLNMSDTRDAILSTCAREQLTKDHNAAEIESTTFGETLLEHAAELMAR
jgi:hypothetical protein